VPEPELVPVLELVLVQVLELVPEQVLEPEQHKRLSRQLQWLAM
jgi:hypothetical protein